MRKIFVLTGPTASGKTALSIALAKALDGEIVSADSMQIYRGMDIGTAKPTLAERDGVPHHMMDVVSPQSRFSVANYVEMAKPIIEDIAQRGKVPLVVGGTGQYIDALVKGMPFAPVADSPQTRHALEEEMARCGGEEMLSRLAEVDEVTAERLYPKDEKRIIRALEIFQLTGKTQSYYDQESKKAPPNFDACMMGLNFPDREDLRQRIYQRVDVMLAEGLMAEVAQFLHLPQDCTAMQAIGYKELRGVLLGEETLAEGVEILKIRSRQYAKRQLTWFRNKMPLTWYEWEKIPNIQNALQFSTDLWTGFQV